MEKISLTSKLDKCICGENNFFLSEKLYWRGYIEGGEMHVKNADNEIYNIECAECGQQYTENEVDADMIINFN
jgi:hypothetical protein